MRPRSACSGWRPHCPWCRRRWSTPGCSSWADVAERLSGAPARIGRCDTGDDAQGRPLAPGEPANLVLIDPSVSRTVDARELASLSRNTPYDGRSLPGRVVATFLRGRPTVLDGKLA